MYVYVYVCMSVCMCFQLTTRFAKGIVGQKTIPFGGSGNQVGGPLHLGSSCRHCTPADRTSPLHSGGRAGPMVGPSWDCVSTVGYDFNKFGPAAKIPKA